MEAAYRRQCEQHDDVSPKERYWLAMDFDREFVLATENDIIMKDFENMSNLLFFSTSPVDEAYDNSIAEHKGCAGGGAAAQSSKGRGGA